MESVYCLQWASDFMAHKYHSILKVKREGHKLKCFDLIKWIFKHLSAAGAF